MAVTKVGILLLSTASYTAVVSSPNPPAPESARAKYDSHPTPLGQVVWPTIYIPAISRLIISSIALFESYLILFPNDTDSPLAQVRRTILRNYPINASNLRTVSPSFLCGCGLLMLGSAMRLYCYRALGRLFTFQLAVFPDHKLITHGPYSVVRHPSYTALVFLMLGGMLVHYGPGSLLNEIFGVKLFWGMMACGSVLGLSFGRRANIEDAVMRKEFGIEWDEWARCVRWKIIPGVF